LIVQYLCMVGIERQLLARLEMDIHEYRFVYGRHRGRCAIERPYDHPHTFPVVLHDREFGGRVMGKTCFHFLFGSRERDPHLQSMDWLMVDASLCTRAL